VSESTKDGPGGRFEELVALIARLRAPGGCPWDREQTHHSLKAMTLEEAYEVVEAIDLGDEALRGELGDLLLQVVFHSQIAREESRFDVADVIDAVSEKMRRRHPHVFGDQEASTPEEVLESWEELKRAEREARGEAAPEDSRLDSVPEARPALMESYQLTEKVARVGFDWPDVSGALAKLREELAELEEVLGPAGEASRRQEEVGDLLLAAVNTARLAGVDPESALKAANRKFRRRFRHVESGLRRQGRRETDATLEEMDALWNEAKALERERGG
jgi:MazG family protein